MLAAFPDGAGTPTKVAIKPRMNRQRAVDAGD